MKISFDDPKMESYLDRVGKATYDVGLLYRGTVRKACGALGLPYEEHKSLLSSLFVVRGTARKLITLNDYLKELDAS